MRKLDLMKRPYTSPFKYLRGLPVLLITVPLLSMADLDVSLHLENQKVLQFEPVYASLTVKNNSSKVFIIRGDTGRMTATVDFDVSRSNSRYAERKNTAPIVSSCIIQPGDSQELDIELSDFFNLSEMGGYNISADVTWNGVRYPTENFLLKVESGLPIMSVVKRVPGPGGEKVVRRFSLKYMDRGRGEQIFILSNNAAMDSCYGVFALGPLVRFRDPEIDVQLDGTVTVFHQSTPTSFTRSILQSEATSLRFIDQSHQSEKSAGHLEFNDEGDAPSGKKRGWWPFGRK